jgi:hypothetical protein
VVGLSLDLRGEKMMKMALSGKEQFVAIVNGTLAFGILGWIRWEGAHT